MMIMSRQTVVSEDMVAVATQRKAQLERELHDITIWLDAARVVLGIAAAPRATNGAVRQVSFFPEMSATVEPPTLPEAIERALVAGENLSAADIRRRLIAEKHPSLRVAESNAFYNALTKMVKRDRLIKAGKAYRLGPKARILLEKS